jgi:hypothetical protein
MEHSTMLTIIVVAIFRALAAAAFATIHVLGHAMQWLIYPDVVRYGACDGCGMDRQIEARERRYAAENPY